MWTACTTLSQILEKTQNPPRPDDPHILILDRGLFDSICWLTLMERLGRVHPEDRKTIEAFLRIEDWRNRISAVIVMTVDPDDAMRREQGLLPVEDGKGSIMNRDVLKQMLETTQTAVDRMQDDFRIFQVNTSKFAIAEGPQRTAEAVTDFVLNIIEEHLEEEILSIPKTEIIAAFQGRRLLPVGESEQLIQRIAAAGDFQPREQVEEDNKRVQILPVVVVRNNSGDVLRLRRKERSRENPLHEKIVIWAGGHLRKEDDSNGDTIIHCAVRELQEELRLCIAPTELKLLGAIYSDVNERTAKHVAIVYEWRAQTDDIAIALSTAEFFERRGTSLSGSFVPIQTLAEDVEHERVDEIWSAEIVRELLCKGQFKFSPRLF